MSDQEGAIGGGGSDEDLSLPKATVNKYVSGELARWPNRTWEY